MNRKEIDPRLTPATRGHADDRSATDGKSSTWPNGEPRSVRDAWDLVAERHAVIADLSRVIAELEAAIASRDPESLAQAVTHAGPVVQRARALIAEWDDRRRSSTEHEETCQ